MSTEITVDETPAASADTAVSDGVAIAETIVEQARAMAGDERAVERSLAEIYDRMDYHAAAAAEAHREILARLDRLETTVAVASVVTEEAIADAMEEVAEAITEEVEESGEEIVAGVEEVAADTATDLAQTPGDEPAARTRKRRFI